MEALLTSTTLVAFAEIGDKTQLLAIALAARFKRPLPIILGILAATFANHFLAAFLGARAAAIFDADWFGYAIAISFILMAGWTLIPDKLEPEKAGPARFGPFLTTLAAFFLVEMGDKTQLATVALGARFANLYAVTAGTTLGMMIANVPAVLLGSQLVQRLPMRLIRFGVAGLFAATGLWLIVRAAAG